MRAVGVARRVRRAPDAGAPGLDEEAILFHGRAIHVALRMGFTPESPISPDDVAGGALVQWLASGRGGGCSWFAVRCRCVDYLRTLRDARRAPKVTRIHPRSAGRADERWTDPMDRFAALAPGPEALVAAAEHPVPSPLAELREVFHTEARWTPAVEERVAAILARVEAAARDEGHATAGLPVIDRVRAWLAAHPGREATHPEIAREVGAARESVSRALAEIRREG